MPTTKKTKSRHFTFDGVPHTRLPPAHRLSPLHNPTLAANKNLPRRERHFRMCLARAQCATDPLNVDLQHFTPPYWLHRPYSSSNSSSGTDASVAGGWEPVVQAVSTTRLARATVATTARPEERQRWMHAGLLTQADVDQAEQVQERVRQFTADPAKMPLFDRVMAECDAALQAASAATRGVGGTEPDAPVDLPMQHGISKSQFESVLGSPVHDAGRAILQGKQEVGVDETRAQVERIVGVATSNAAQILKYRVARVREAFGRHPADCGSPQVICALLTLRIRNLAQHVYQFTQDTEARVQLEQLTHRRRRMLRYLKSTDFTAYMTLCRDLALKFA